MTVYLKAVDSYAATMRGVLKHVDVPGPAVMFGGALLRKRACVEH